MVEDNTLWIFDDFADSRRQMSAKVKITEIPGRGLGLLATDDITAGDLILRGLFQIHRIRKPIINVKLLPKLSFLKLVLIILNIIKPLINQRPPF